MRAARRRTNTHAWITIPATTGLRKPRSAASSPLTTRRPKTRSLEIAVQTTPITTSAVAETSKPTSIRLANPTMIATTMMVGESIATMLRIRTERNSFAYEVPRSCDHRGRCAGREGIALLAIRLSTTVSHTVSHACDGGQVDPISSRPRDCVRNGACEKRLAHAVSNRIEVLGYRLTVMVKDHEFNHQCSEREKSQCHSPRDPTRKPRQRDHHTQYDQERPQDCSQPNRDFDRGNPTRVALANDGRPVCNVRRRPIPFHCVSQGLFEPSRFVFTAPPLSRLNLVSTTSTWI